MVAASIIDLVVRVAGLSVAWRRHHPYDLPGMRGRVEHLGRDAVALGTAFSPPVWMLGVQAVSTARRRALLAPLGAAMVIGQLAERQGRRRLREWDPVESTIVIAGLISGSALTFVSRRAARARADRPRGSRRAA